MKISEDLIKNDVPASGQLKDGDSVSFNLKEGADLKITFLGNSITRHGVAEDLGWRGDWGMAASARQNDYVHRLVSLFEESGKRVSYCIANLSEWERSGDAALFETRYASALNFNADLVIVRLGENANLTQRLKEFKRRYAQLVKRFTANGARAVCTDLFWEYQPFDSFVEEFARAGGYAFVRLHDLGRQDKMKAVGKFSHAGVAAHPGDCGMAEIAKRIFGAAAQN